jgi:hypothetical protein
VLGKQACGELDNAKLQKLQLKSKVSELGDSWCEAEAEYVEVQRMPGVGRSEALPSLQSGTSAFKKI